MGQDERQGARAAAADVIEVNVEIFYARDELRKAIQLFFRLVPIEARGPVSREFLHVVPIGAVLPPAVQTLWEARVTDSRKDAIDSLFGDGYAEGAWSGGRGLCRQALQEWRTREGERRTASGAGHSPRSILPRPVT